MKTFLFLLLPILNVMVTSFSYKICIVGAGSRLGRELAFQGLTDYNTSILGLTNSDTFIEEPYRGDGFNEIPSTKKMNFHNLKIDNYWSYIPDNYEHLILCTGAGPFEKDYSDKLTAKMLQSLPSKCRSINLVSAWGTGDSLSQSDWGIQIMNSWYLQDTYRAKNEQERMIQEFQGDIEKRIYRVKALSFGNTFLESTSRYDLASEILENIFLLENK